MPATLIRITERYLWFQVYILAPNIFQKNVIFNSTTLFQWQADATGTAYSLHL